MWVALAQAATPEALNDLRSAKWGSATDRRGDERVVRTEVPGWGWDGLVGSASEAERHKGRKKGARDLTIEAREEFEITGAKCWRAMEQLRREWEVLLGVKRCGLCVSGLTG